MSGVNLKRDKQEYQVEEKALQRSWAEGNCTSSKCQEMGQMTLSEFSEESSSRISDQERCTGDARTGESI